jgi:hypothetical protein
MPACQCTERKRPLTCAPGSNDRARQWFVLRRNYTQSAFNGYRQMWSDYSDLSCRVCGAHWRSKAPFVAALLQCSYWPRTIPPKAAPYETLKESP